MRTFVSFCASVASRPVSRVSGPRDSVSRIAPRSRSWVLTLPPIIIGLDGSTVLRIVTPVFIRPIPDDTFPFTAMRLKGPLTVPLKVKRFPRAIFFRLRFVAGDTLFTKRESPSSVNERFLMLTPRRLCWMLGMSITLPLRRPSTLLPCSLKWKLSRLKSFT